MDDFCFLCYREFFFGFGFFFTNIKYHSLFISKLIFNFDDSLEMFNRLDRVNIASDVAADIGTEEI